MLKVDLSWVPVMFIQGATSDRTAWSLVTSGTMCPTAAVATGWWRWSNAPTGSISAAWRTRWWERPTTSPPRCCCAKVRENAMHHFRINIYLTHKKRLDQRAKICWTHNQDCTYSRCLFKVNFLLKNVCLVRRLHPAVWLVECGSDPVWDVSGTATLPGPHTHWDPDQG